MELLDQMYHYFKVFTFFCLFFLITEIQEEAISPHLDTTGLRNCLKRYKGSSVCTIGQFPSEVYMLDTHHII